MPERSNPSGAAAVPVPSGPAAPRSLPESRIAAGRPRRVLFIEHAASRNGASLLLLELLQWLQGSQALQCEVLCTSRGVLLPDFRAVARTHALLRPYRLQRGRPSVEVDGPAAWLAERWFHAFLRWRGIDLVYANTAATWPWAASTLRSRVPLLWHIHELPYALDLSLDAPHSRELLARARRVVAVSQPVSDALVSAYGVAGDHIDLVHGFVPPPRAPGADVADERGQVLAELGWPADAFVVGACGGLGWRKGSELFLQLARRLQRADAARPLRFLWVGGGPAGDTEALRFQHDVQALGLNSHCRRITGTDRVDRYYAAMDVFALTSREDPFPLVVLEAAGHGVPTVAFAGAGGAPEFLAEGAGLVVPYLDLEVFAAALLRLCKDPGLRSTLGRNAQRRAAARHRVETQGPLLLRSIQRCLALDGAAH